MYIYTVTQLIPNDCGLCKRFTGAVSGVHRDNSHHQSFQNIPAIRDYVATCIYIYVFWYTSLLARLLACSLAPLLPSSLSCLTFTLYRRLALELPLVVGIRSLRGVSWLSFPPQVCFCIDIFGGF